MDANDKKSLQLFCKPVMLYHLKRHSQAKRFIHQRCLTYKIQAKKNKKKKSGGILIFNYMDRDNKCLKSEVTRKFSCPFCLVSCGSHEGVKGHLTSSHYHFDYSFWLWNKNQLQIAVSVKLDAFNRNGELIDDLETHKWLPFTFLEKGRKRSQRDDSDTMKRMKVHFSELDLGDLPRHDTENGLTHVDDGDVMITSPTIAHSPEKTSCEILPTTPPERTKSPEKTSSEILQITQPERAESSKPRVALTRTYERRRLKSSSKSKITQPEMAKSPEKTSCKTLQITEPETAKSPLDSKGKNKSADRTESKSVSKSPEITHSPEKTSCKTLQITQPETAKSSEPMAPLDSKGKKKSPKRTQSKKRVKSLTERQFYHSHSSQPMSTDKVLSKSDSEDEAYDDSDDTYERLRMAQLKDVSEEDKHFMCLWNTLIDRQRVLADGHIPWACEEFTKLHQKELISSQTLWWKWRLLMVTLSKHGLVCGNTIHKCNTFLLKAQAAAAAAPAPAPTPAPAPAQAAAAAEASPSASASTSQATVMATSNNLWKLIEKYSNHGSASASTSQATAMAMSNDLRELLEKLLEKYSNHGSASTSQATVMATSDNLRKLIEKYSNHGDR